MTAIVLSLAGAVMYGISDFVGALASRRASAWPAALIAATVGALTGAVVAVLDPGSPSGTDLGWAVLAGVGEGFGISFLYRGLAAGRMGVVAPTSAVCAAGLPVIVATLAGEQPGFLAWIGMAAALPGIWLVSQEPGTRWGGPGLIDGLIAGLGFGLSFIGLGQVPETAGWWPLSTMNLVAAVVIVLVATMLHQPMLTRDRAAYAAAIAGVLAAGAMAAFIVATSRGLVSISAVLISLYPAVTILLAVTLLRERIHRIQAFGLVLCVGAVTLVALGG